jgi:putative heme iron utilization protein
MKTFISNKPPQWSKTIKIFKTEYLILKFKGKLKPLIMKNPVYNLNYVAEQMGGKLSNKKEKIIKSDTFMQKLFDGEVQMLEIDNYIEQWHNSNSEKSLHEFLGMSWEEYSLFIKDPKFFESCITLTRIADPNYRGHIW